MKIKTLKTVAVHTITDASNAMVSTIVVQVEGITADSGSMVPMQRISMSGVPGTAPTRRNCIYTNRDTGTPVAAGTAITADGFYEFNANGAELYMNVTAVTAGFTCYITPLEGPSGGGGGGGGVSEAVTLASGAVASGAYSAGSIAAGAAVAGASVDLASLLTLLGTTVYDGAHAALNVTLQYDNTAAPANPLQVQLRNNAGTAVTILPASTPADATNVTLAVQPIPTELHLGAVGGNSLTLTTTLTVSTSPAYAAGDAVGGMSTLAAMRISGGTGVLENLLVVDHSNQKPNLDILFFTSSPPSTTVTDNSAFPTLSQAADALVIARVSIASTDWVTVGGSGFASPTFQPKVVTASGSANLYMAVNTSSTPTFVATTDIMITTGFLRD